MYSLKKAILIVLAAGLCASLRADDSNRDQAIELYNQASSAYEQHDFGTAGTNLDAALQLEPNFSEAYLLKGMLEYQEGQPTRAKALMQRAAELNPLLSAEIRSALQQRALAAENHLTSQDFAHFHLEFLGAERRDDAWEAVQELDEAYNELGSVFGVFPPGKIPVIILTGPQYQAVWLHPAWEAGFYSALDGHIRIRLDQTRGGPSDYRRRLRHELTHAYLHAICPVALPRWFNEGVAEFYAYETPSDMQWKEDLLEKLGHTLKSTKWLSVEQIDYVHSHNNAVPAGAVALAYLEGQALVLYIAQERGESWIPSVVEHLRQTGSPESDPEKFAAAFQDVAGVAPNAMLQKLYESYQ